MEQNVIGPPPVVANFQSERLLICSSASRPPGLILWETSSFNVGVLTGD